MDGYQGCNHLNGLYMDIKFNTTYYRCNDCGKILGVKDNAMDENP